MGKPMSLNRSISSVGFNTLLSRILGFARDIILARVFGADAHTDAFFVAFKIPNFLRRLFAEGAFSMAFVPVLGEYREKQGKERLLEFIGRVAGTLGGILLLVTLLGVLGAPLLIALFAPGFWDYPEKQELAARMLQLTFPYLLFISLTAFAGGILNSYQRFAVPAFTPVLLNLSLIGCAIWLAPLTDPGIMALAWGVLLAGLVQMLFQLPFLHRLGLLTRPRLGFRDAGVRRILKLMAPALFGVSVTQINLLLDTLIASFLISGSISWLYYSDRLMEFPIGVLGVALGTVILPNLSSQHASENPKAFAATLAWALRWVLFLGLPSTLGLMLLAQPLLATLFFSQAFDARDVAMASSSLIAYAVGLLGFMLIKVLAPGYYARQNTRTPVRIAVIAMLVNMTFNLILVWPLAHVGLALATSISALTNAALLARGLQREGIFRPDNREIWFLKRVLAALAIMGLLLWLACPESGAWIRATGQQRVLWLSGLLALGVFSYFAMVYSLGLRPRHFAPNRGLSN
jgi:putative peptidoglycan lipid II flippase